MDISDVADFFSKENINDFSAWLAASAAQDAYYKIHPQGGFLFKRDMGATQLLYLYTTTDQAFISEKMQALREEPLDVNSAGHVFGRFFLLQILRKLRQALLSSFWRKS